MHPEAGQWRPPGLNPARLLRLMETAADACRLDLSGTVVLTEAASGPYVVTPVLAAMAKAESVVALARTSRYGTAAELGAGTLALARMAGVSERIEIVTEKRPEVVARADIVTNSGHLRPIDAAMVGWMKPTAVVPLMFEAWELHARTADLDLEALQRRGIQVAGTNERHPAVDVFSYLGAMAAKLLLDSGVAVHRSRVSIICDNPFGPWLLGGLAGFGAEVSAHPSTRDLPAEERPDAILVALRPGPGPVLDAAEADRIAAMWPGTVVAQFWGDIDRQGLSAADVPYWPADAPPPGHMGILPSGIGPEPVVRLQAGGLKVGQVLLQPEDQRSESDRSFIDAL
jgi:hypothetical protein